VITGFQRRLPRRFPAAAQPRRTPAPGSPPAWPPRPVAVRSARPVGRKFAGPTTLAVTLYSAAALLNPLLPSASKHLHVRRNQIKNFLGRVPVAPEMNATPSTRNATAVVLIAFIYASRPSVEWNWTPARQIVPQLALREFRQDNNPERLWLSSPCRTGTLYHCKVNRIVIQNTYVGFSCHSVLTAI